MLELPEDAAVKFKVLPAHKGLVPVTIGFVADGLITTAIVAGNDVQLFTVVVTLYVPEAVTGTLVMVTVFEVLVKLSGPFHAKETFDVAVVADSCKMPPLQTGLLPVI